MEYITTLLMQCPVVGIFAWFLVTITKENNRKFERMQAEHTRQFERMQDEHCRQMERISVQFQAALDKVVDKIGGRLKRIERTLDLQSGDSRIIPPPTPSVS